MQADEIKSFIDDERRRQKITQEKISEAADLPDMYQSYQRYMTRQRGSLYTTISLLAALGYEVEIRQKGGVADAE